MIKKSNLKKTQKIPKVIVKSNSGKQLHKSTLLARGVAKIITSKQIKISGAHNITQLLQAMSAIQLQDYYGDGSKVQVSMRGFGDNAIGNTLILLNGVPLVNPTLAAPDFNEIPVSIVKQIEIFPTSVGVLYGDQAVGGAINIVTKPPRKHQRRIAVSIGSYAAQQYQLTFGDVFNNGFGYRIYASHYKTDNYRHHNNKQQNNLDALVNYKFDTGKIYLQYQNINRHLQLPGYAPRDNRRAAKNDIDYNNQKNNILLAGLTKELSENWQFNFDTFVKHLYGNGSLSMLNVGYPFTEKQNNFVLHPKIHGIINLFSTSLGAILGVDYLDGAYVYDSTSYYSKASQAESAGYGQITVPLKSKLDLIIGARTAMTRDYKRTAMLGSNLHGSGKDYATISDVNLIWHVNPVTQVFVKRAGSYRFPKAGELALSEDQQMLKTQTGVSYEAGYKWHNQRAHLFLDGYQLNLRNEILFLPYVEGETPGKNVNLSPTVRRGLILNADYLLRRNLKVLLSYSFVNAKFSSGVNKGNAIPFVARNTLRLMASYALDSHWTLFAEGIYIGSRYPAGDIKNWTSKLGGYTVYNTNLNYYHRPFTFSLRCNNITNKYYYGYSTATYVGNQATTYYYPAPDRNFMLTMTVDLP
jgi:iron complex outermembrane receptor protein